MHNVKKSIQALKEEYQREHGRVCLIDRLRFEAIEQALEEKERQDRILEGIKEEIGIDLVTLFKALKNGVYLRDYELTTNPIKFIKIKNYEIDLDNLRFDVRRERLDRSRSYQTGGLFFYFKDYGKTWVLAEEELENE